jgi:Flp pilus assembly protein TadG
MNISRVRLRKCTPREGGAAVVEFALVAAVFLTLLIGIMELGRVFFYWNTAAEVTRRGARMAVVCDMNDAHIKARMNAMLPVVPSNKIQIDYHPSGCTATTCESVTVRILPGVVIGTYVPFVPFAPEMAPFTTTLPRESMNSAGGANPACN